MTQPIERVIQSMGYAREITPPQRVDFQVQAFEDEEEIDSTTSTPEGYVRQDEMATLMMRHAKEMEIFQTEYGKRVESLTAALNEMKLQFKHSQKYAGSPAVSSTTLLAKPSSKGNPAPSKLTEKQTPVVRWQKQPSYPEGVSSGELHLSSFDYTVTLFSSVPDQIGVLCQGESQTPRGTDSEGER
eukprot:m.238868 g.238868  ORF g.238868 m.238868 type:complete len:186 (+) comp40174_c0_seq9:247-804(+)